jgi:predicted phosphodiesterase
MRYAFISDIHANLPALEAVLEDIDRRDVQGTWHLGDLVGYAPWPNEVVSLLSDRGISGVSGNYDSTVGLNYKHCGCRYEDPRQEALSHLSFEWTKQACTAQTRAALAALSFRMDLHPLGGHAAGPAISLVHGTPVLNTVYWTEDRPDDFCRKMAGTAGLKEGDVMAFGHTHLPWHRVVDGVHFVNTGSVGRPKDGDSRAGYCILSIGNGGSIAVEHVRVPYNVVRASEAIRHSDLPDEFAWYLESGGRRLEGPS